MNSASYLHYVYYLQTVLAPREKKIRLLATPRRPKGILKARPHLGPDQGFCFELERWYRGHRYFPFLWTRY